MGKLFRILSHLVHSQKIWCAVSSAWTKGIPLSLLYFCGFHVSLLWVIAWQFRGERSTSTLSCTPICSRNNIIHDQRPASSPVHSTSNWSETPHSPFNSSQKFNLSAHQISLYKFHQILSTSNPTQLSTQKKTQQQKSDPLKWEHLATSPIDPISPAVAPATSQVHMEIPATSRRWKTPRRTWYHYCHGQSVGRPGRSDPTHHR